MVPWTWYQSTCKTIIFTWQSTLIIPFRKWQENTRIIYSPHAFRSKPWWLSPPWRGGRVCAPEITHVPNHWLTLQVKLADDDLSHRGKNPPENGIQIRYTKDITNVIWLEAATFHLQTLDTFRHLSFGNTFYTHLEEVTEKQFVVDKVIIKKKYFGPLKR
jgi:hypothetical protein